MFGSLEKLPPDPILSLNELLKEDKRETVNLGIGVYMNDEGRTRTLSTVKAAEKSLLEKEANKNYLPIGGSPPFCEEIQKMIFGKSDPRIFTAQSVGASGALRLGAEFLASAGCGLCHLSSPSWSNHRAIFQKCGFSIQEYPYLDFEAQRLDFEGFCAAVEKMQPEGAVLLHACCHNPSGIDPSLEQWKRLSSLIKERRLIPFFDFAYQGFKEGVDEDAAAVRLFFEEGHEMLVSHSCSKNFGLYGERVGSLSFVAGSAEGAETVGSHLKNLLRTLHSSSPMHGAKIVAAILRSPELKRSWQEELQTMRSRLKEMRKKFTAAMEKEDPEGSWGHIPGQAGLFSILGLSRQQVLQLREQKGVYMPPDSRMNFAGLNSTNIEKAAKAILSIKYSRAK